MAHSKGYATKSGKISPGTAVQSGNKSDGGMKTAPKGGAGKGGSPMKGGCK